MLPKMASPSPGPTKGGERAEVTKTDYQGKARVVDLGDLIQENSNVPAAQGYSKQTNVAASTSPLRVEQGLRQDKAKRTPEVRFNGNPVRVDASVAPPTTETTATTFTAGPSPMLGQPRAIPKVRRLNFEEDLDADDARPSPPERVHHLPMSQLSFDDYDDLDDVEYNEV